MHNKVRNVETLWQLDPIGGGGGEGGGHYYYFSPAIIAKKYFKS